MIKKIFFAFFLVVFPVIYKEALAATEASLLLELVRTPIGQRGQKQMEIARYYEGEFKKENGDPGKKRDLISQAFSSYVSAGDSYHQKGNLFLASAAYEHAFRIAKDNRFTEHSTLKRLVERLESRIRGNAS